MAQASMKFELPTRPDVLWQAITSFQTFGQGLPGVERVASDDGKTTRLKFRLPTGGELNGKIEQASETERVYAYSIGGPSGAPVNYVASVRIRAKGGGRCEVEWTSNAHRAELAGHPGVQWLENAYRMGFDALKQTFGLP
jgi:carbon monoxide dehydrogenase subunit G